MMTVPNAPQCNFMIWYGAKMAWPSDKKPDAIKLDDGIPLPPGEYTASYREPINPAVTVINNFRPNVNFKTWPVKEHAEIAASYLRKYETAGWRFTVEVSPTNPIRFVIVAWDDWGARKGFI